MGKEIGLARSLDREFPGRTYMVIAVGGLDRPRGMTTDIAPDYQNTEATQARECQALRSPSAPATGDDHWDLGAM
jgi:hypothetical protein